VNLNVRQKLKAALPERVLEARTSLARTVDEMRYRVWSLRAPSHVRLVRPIFVIGCPRSGTTLAANMIGLHPELANVSEAGRLWDPRHYDDDNADHFWAPDHATPDEIDRVHRRFEHARRRIGSERRLLNKHPRMSVRLDFLTRAFPDAFYLHVIRDGRAAASSMVQRLARWPERPQHPLGQFVRPKNWRELRRDNPLEEGILVWREIVQHVLDAKPQLAPRYMEMRYEDLCADPTRVLRDTLGFLELSNDDRSVANLMTEKLESRNFKVERLPASDVEMMNRLAGPLLKTLGYRT